MGKCSIGCNLGVLASKLSLLRRELELRALPWRVAVRIALDGARNFRGEWLRSARERPCSKKPARRAAKRELKGEKSKTKAGRCRSEPAAPRPKRPT